MPQAVDVGATVQQPQFPNPNLEGSESATDLSFNVLFQSEGNTSEEKPKEEPVKERKMRWKQVARKIQSPPNRRSNRLRSKFGKGDGGPPVTINLESSDADDTPLSPPQDAVAQVASKPPPHPLSVQKRKIESVARSARKPPKLTVSTSSDRTSSGDESEHSEGESDESRGVCTEFYSEAALKRWGWFKDRCFALDRSVDVDNLEVYNLGKFLDHAGLLKACTYAGPFVSDVVKQFYANLTKSFSDVSSKSFGKVYVRGKMFHITPHKINKFLGRKDCVDTVVSVNVPVMARLLTRDKEKEWKGSGVSQHHDCRADHLTSLFAVLHKIMTFNWLPTSNNTGVSIQQMEILYKIGMGIQFDLGKIIFDEIASHAERKSRSYLPYPSLIFEMLKKQKLKPTESDSFTSKKSLWSLHASLLSSDHYEDLPWDGIYPIGASSDQNTDSSPVCQFAGTMLEHSGSQLVYMDTLIAALEDQLQRAKANRKVIFSVFSSQKGGDGDGAEPSHRYCYGQGGTDEGGDEDMEEEEEADEDDEAGSSDAAQ